MGTQKQNYQKSGDARRKKIRLHEEAEARKRLHEMRTPQEQLLLIATRRGNSGREKAKLLALIG